MDRKRIVGANVISSANMSLDKISVTLYDLLGYLLPGFVLLLVFSIAEASFFGNSSLFALPRIEQHPLISSIFAYFLGHASHGAGSWLIDKRHKWFAYKGFKLSPAVMRRVSQTINETYRLEMEEDEKLSSAETYFLADSYIVAHGGSTERDILTAREGFYKATMIAFAVLFITLLSTAFIRTRIQIQSGVFTTVNWVGTILISAGVLLLVGLFRQRYMFFNCIKKSNTMRTFLALQHRSGVSESNKSKKL